MNSIKKCHIIKNSAALTKWCSERAEILSATVPERSSFFSLISFVGRYLLLAGLRISIFVLTEPSTSETVRLENRALLGTREKMLPYEDREAISATCLASMT